MSKRNSVPKAVDSARSFIEKDNASIRAQNRIYLIFAFVCLFIALIAVIAVVFLTPLKKVEPYIMRVDNSTGKVDVISVLPRVTQSYDRVVDNHFLSLYVQYRESYDWQTISDFYAATKLMSNPQVSANYTKLYGRDNVNSPVNSLKNQYRILVRINSISYIGKTAQIRFTKIKIPVVPNETDQIQEFNYLATVTFKYENKEMSSVQRQVNPLGFTVTSYNISSDGI